MLQCASLQQFRLCTAIHPCAEGNHVQADIHQGSTSHSRIIQTAHFLAHLKEDLPLKVQNLTKLTTINELFKPAKKDLSSLLPFPCDSQYHQATLQSVNSNCGSCTSEHFGTRRALARSCTIIQEHTMQCDGLSYLQRGVLHFPCVNLQLNWGL